MLIGLISAFTLSHNLFYFILFLTSKNTCIQIKNDKIQKNLLCQILSIKNSKKEQEQFPKAFIQSYNDHNIHCLMMKLFGLLTPSKT